MVSAGSSYFIQFTDTHLFADPTETLWEVSPDARLDETVHAVAEIRGRPRFILVTGDCSADGSDASYGRLAEKLAIFSAPIYYLPGNHDDPACLAKMLSSGSLNDNGKLTQTFEDNGWRFVLLDSAIPNEDGGELGHAQLAWLRRQLHDHAKTPTIIAVHHAPMPVGSPWLDEMKLVDGPQLIETIDAAPQVRAVLFGHVHQIFETHRQQTLYASAPSTFFQFAPGSVDFAGDGANPGARIVELRDGGSFNSFVVRVNDSGKADIA